jgi:hypothetical protein
MRRFTVQLDASPSLNLWHPRNAKDAHWLTYVEADSEAHALAIMRLGPYKDIPMRVVPSIG